MPKIELNDSEFSALMFVLANAEGKGITWAMVNPLLMNIGNQARMQQQVYRGDAATADFIAKEKRRSSKNPEGPDEPTH